MILLRGIQKHYVSIKDVIFITKNGPGPQQIPNTKMVNNSRNRALQRTYYPALSNSLQNSMTFRRISLLLRDLFTPIATLNSPHFYADCYLRQCHRPLTGPYKRNLLAYFFCIVRVQVRILK